MKELDEMDWPAVVDLVRGAGRSEIERLALAFGWITSRYLERARQEIELLRAIPDEETLVKEQIKTSTIEHTRQIFQRCYQLVTGRRAWDEQDDF